MPYVGLTTDDPDTQYPPIEPLRPPDGAPNVLIILLDDVGFGASSAFGGPCHTPTAERLAGNGLRYNRFHTTALCSPARQAMLTGRAITLWAWAASPRWPRRRPATAPSAPNPVHRWRDAQAQRLRHGPVRQVPRSAGVGDQSPPVRSTPGPRAAASSTSTGSSAARPSQYYPSLYEGTTPVAPAKTPAEGYHITEDLADHAIQWVRRQSLMPDKPVFMYFATGATHAPHHVPKAWSDKYKGRFDQGGTPCERPSLDRRS
ncbi:MAG: sulfatase-like hydrolase/transferase [Caldilineaceae bacterium]